MPDLGVFNRYKGFNDFEDQNRKASLADALTRAQINKIQQPSLSDVFNGAAIRAAAGNPQEGDDKILQAYSGLHPRSNIGGMATPAIPATKKPAPVAISPVTETSSNLIGDDFLKTLPPQRASVIKLIGDGNEKSSTVLSRMKPEEKLSILSDVSRYNPKYSANDFPGVSTFNRGQEGKTVRSFNVAIEHLNTLEPLIVALKNGDTQLINKIANSASNQFGGVAINNFETAKSIVADEIAKAVIGGQNAEKDRADLQSKLNSAKSEDQLMGVLGTFKDLMAGQLSGLDKQYQTSTGRNDFKERLLLPSAKQEYEKHSGLQSITSSTPIVKTQAQFDALPSGSRYIEIINGKPTPGTKP